MRNGCALLWLTLSLVLATMLNAAAEDGGAATRPGLAPAIANGPDIDLNGAWRFRTDPDTEKDAKEPAHVAWAAPELDDADWQTLEVGRSWEKQKLNYNGQAWYRRRLVIPQDWGGGTLALNLGWADDGAHLYFNGTPLGTFQHKQPITLVLPPNVVRFGQENVIAVCVWDNYKDGGLSGEGFFLRKLGAFAPRARAERPALKPRPTKGAVDAEAVRKALDENPTKAKLAALYDSKALQAFSETASLWGGWRLKTTSWEEQFTEPDLSGSQVDDASWPLVLSSATWESLGMEHYGDGWYRQRVHVPAAWAGQPLVIDFGRRGNPSINGGYDRMDDRVYVNGQLVGGYAGEYKFRTHNVRRYAVAPGAIRYGEENLIAVRISAPANQGLLGEQDIVLSTQPCGIMLRDAGSGRDAEVPATWYDISDSQSGAGIEMVARLPHVPELAAEAKLFYAVSDTFGNVLTAGDTPVSILGRGDAEAVVALPEDVCRTLYLRSRMHVTVYVVNPDGTAVWALSEEHGPFTMYKRDRKSLPALAEQFEETAYGKARLIDVVDCSVPFQQDEHPYIESGLDGKIKFREPGSPADVRIETILGRPCRTVNEGFFGYRIGRGSLKPHHGYIVRVEYPEDTLRYANVTLSNHHAYMDVGWKGGVAADDPHDNYPLSGTYQNFDTFTVLDNYTYGSGGTGSAPMENGLWVFVMDKGRRSTPQYEGGPAVTRIKLYELDAIAHAPDIRYPEGMPRRTFTVDWERQSNEIPEDMVKYCRFMGYNAVSPLILKWTFDLYADHDLPYREYQFLPRTRNRFCLGMNEETGKPKPCGLNALQKNQHEAYLEATRKHGLGYLPRLEYGGSLTLPDEAKAIGKDGKLDPAGRYASWGANLLHPATLSDMQALLDAVIGASAKDNPQLGGVLWRIRCGRMQVSYGKADVELFCRETGREMPALDGAALSGWAAASSEYHDWWDQKRSQFHNAVGAILAGYNPDMKLLIHLWDTDKWSLGLPCWFSAGNWGALSKKRGKEREFYQDYVARRNAIAPADYATMIRTGDNLLDRYAFGPHERLLNNLYADAANVRFFAPANYRFLSDNQPYLEAFRTGAGLAVTNMITYDEHTGRYLSPRYETSMLVPAGPAFSVANEVLACFNSDPDVLSYTSYTFGRGFADAHRAFAQAYLALPAVRGEELPDALETPDPDVRVRRYAGGEKAVYVGIVSRALVEKDLVVRVPWDKATLTAVDQVSGQTLEAGVENGQAVLRLRMAPMQLRTVMLKESEASGLTGSSTASSQASVLCSRW